MVTLKVFFISFVLECSHLNHALLNTDCLDNLGILNEENNTHEKEHCQFTEKKYSDDRTSTESSETRNLEAHKRDDLKNP